MIILEFPGIQNLSHELFNKISGKGEKISCHSTINITATSHITPKTQNNKTFSKKKSLHTCFPNCFIANNISDFYTIIITIVFFFKMINSNKQNITYIHIILITNMGKIIGFLFRNYDEI